MTVDCCRIRLNRWSTVNCQLSWLLTVSCELGANLQVQDNEKCMQYQSTIKLKNWKFFFEKTRPFTFRKGHFQQVKWSTWMKSIVNQLINIMPIMGLYSGPTLDGRGNFRKVFRTLEKFPYGATTFSFDMEWYSI